MSKLLAAILQFSKTSKDDASSILSHNSHRGAHLDGLLVYVLQKHITENYTLTFCRVTSSSKGNSPLIHLGFQSASSFSSPGQFWAAECNTS